MKTILEIVCEARGWSGGTIHQVSEEIGAPRYRDMSVESLCHASTNEVKIGRWVRQRMGTRPFKTTKKFPSAFWYGYISEALEEERGMGYKNV